MEETTAQVSAKRKLTILNRIHLVASMTEEYCTDKKMLNALTRVLKQETKKLTETKYPFSDGDINTLNYYLAELQELVQRFKKVKKVDQYRTVSTSLEEYFANLNKEIAETSNLLKEKSDTRKKIEGVFENINGFGDRLGKKLGENVKKLKNSKRDRDSE